MLIAKIIQFTLVSTNIGYLPCKENMVTSEIHFNSRVYDHNNCHIEAKGMTNLYFA